jgi:hypothetical protein
VSNLIFNMRFGAYHLQIVRFYDWRWMIREGLSPITINFNGYHAKGGPARRNNTNWKWWEWYE